MVPHPEPRSRTIGVTVNPTAVLLARLLLYQPASQPDVYTRYISIYYMYTVQLYSTDHNSASKAG